MNHILKASIIALLGAATLVATVGESQAMGRRSYCRWQAREAAGHASGNNVAGGAVAGAAIGGIFGAITGHGAASNTLTGVAAGGIGGGLLGAAGSHNAGSRAYWDTYNACMNDY